MIQSLSFVVRTYKKSVQGLLRTFMASTNIGFLHLSSPQRVDSVTHSNRNLNVKSSIATDYTILSFAIKSRFLSLIRNRFKSDVATYLNVM